MERIVFVHGSVVGGKATWSAQSPLAEHFELVVLDRLGFPPHPPIARVDFEEQAAQLSEELKAGDHLVGHSYGGVICLLAAAGAADRLSSLSVLEPPATRVALGNALVDRFAMDAETWWSTGPTDDPEAFLRGFLSAVGSTFRPPSPLPPELEQGAKALVAERGPWEAEIPLEMLAAAPFPKLVVSGAHHPAFDAICAVLVQRLGAERAVLEGYGHTVQRHPDFNALLATFVVRAAARTT